MLLDVEGAATATTAQGVRLIMSFAETRGTLGYTERIMVSLTDHLRWWRMRSVVDVKWLLSPRNTTLNQVSGVDSDGF